MPRGSEHERARSRRSLSCFLRPFPERPLTRRSHAKPTQLAGNLFLFHRARGGARRERSAAHRTRALCRRHGRASRHRPCRGAPLAARARRDRLHRRFRRTRSARGGRRPDGRGRLRMVPAVHRRREDADAALCARGRTGALRGGAGRGGRGARPQRTNKTPSGLTRGLGGPQAYFAIASVFAREQSSTGALPATSRTMFREPQRSSRGHSMSAAADTARTDGHHPCLTTHMPTFEVLRSTENLGVRISYSQRALSLHPDTEHVDERTAGHRHRRRTWAGLLLRTR